MVDTNQHIEGPIQVCIPIYKPLGLAPKAFKNLEHCPKYSYHNHISQFHQFLIVSQVQEYQSQVSYCAPVIVLRLTELHRTPGTVLLQPPFYSIYMYSQNHHIFITNHVFDQNKTLYYTVYHKHNKSGL